MSIYISQPHARVELVGAKPLLSALMSATVLLVSMSATHEAQAEKRWYKGNTHAHSLWSDGDAPPEVVVAWYKENGYDFLCLSEHNFLADGSVERWFPITSRGRLRRETVDRLKTDYGDDWVEERTRHGRETMRLKLIPELKTHFEEPGEFILMQGEEVTSVIPPIHLNAVNIKEFLPAANFMSKTEAFIANIEFVEQQSARYGVPMAVHINHPNWREGFSAETLFPIDGPLIFEVYNGHAVVRNNGDEALRMVSNDRFWDIVLSMRLMRGKENVLYGIGTEDSHSYYRQGPREANPGRGWTMVLAESLTPDAITSAINRGDCYASSGVELKSILADDETIRIEISAEVGVQYTTQFIGTRKGFDASSEAALDDAGKPMPDATRVYSDEIGAVLLETTANPAIYTFKGDELYVRAKIISSKLQENPVDPGTLESAWIQPLVLDE